MKTTALSILFLAINTLLSPLAWAQEEEDLALFKDALEELKKANLTEELELRRLLQDADLESLADPDEAIRMAKERMKDLQESGFISPDVLDKAASAVGLESGTSDENVASTDVLGPPPLKAPKTKPENPLEGMISIENSGKFVGSTDDGVLVFSDDVFVTTDQFTMRCDRLEVHLEEPDPNKGANDRGIKSVVATGRMVVIKGIDEKDQPVEARCQTAIYQDDVMYLRDWPELKMGERMVKAKDKSAYIKLESSGSGSDRKLRYSTHGAIDIQLPKVDTGEGNS